MVVRDYISLTLFMFDVWSSNLQNCSAIGTI